MSSVDTPITVAPKAANWSVASANACASAEQPDVNDFGKKYSTTGPLASACASENWNTLPFSAAAAVKSGAFWPTASAASAGDANNDNAAIAVARPEKMLRFMPDSSGRGSPRTLTIRPRCGACRPGLSSGG